MSKATPNSMYRLRGGSDQGGDLLRLKRARWVRRARGVLAPAIEPLEGRVLFSVSASMLAGTLPTGTVSTFQTKTTGSVTPTFVKTTLPASVVAGGTTHGTATIAVTNPGSSTLKELVATQLDASTDGTIDGSSIVLGTVTRTLTIKPGGTVDVVVPIKSLPATLDGTYTLLAETGDPTGIAIAASGPTLVAAAPFIAFSDEAITSTLTSSVVSGSKTSATASITLTNTGNIASKGTTTIELLVSPDGTVDSGTEILTRSAPVVVKPGQTKTVKIPLKVLPNVTDGTYQVVAQLTDPNDDVTSAATTTTANLAAAFIDLVPTITAITPGPGGTETVSITVINNGNITPTGKSTIDLYGSTGTTAAGAISLVNDPVVLALRPGKSKTVKLHLTANLLTTAQGLGNFVVGVIDPLDGMESASAPGPA